MAPEMAEGMADERTDVFLLGATLHEVLTGVPRHEGETALDVLYAAMYVEPYAYPASVPAELAELCNRACARAPDARFPDVDALRAAVLRYREHRAANLLTEDAQVLLERLRAASAAQDTEAPGYDALQLLHAETRRAFEAALRIWPESPGARLGLTTCLQIMIDHELERRHLLAAEALLGMLPVPDELRRMQVEGLRAELAREQARLLRSERDRDPSVGALGRTRAYLGIGVATALMTAALSVRRLLVPDAQPSTLRLTVVGAVVLAIGGLATLLWHRYGTFNFINRRIAEISLATLAVSFASRLSGYWTDTAPERVLASDAFILGLGGLVLAPYHRAGPWLAGLSFGVAALGSWRPELIDELFIIPSIVIPITILFLKRVQSRARSRAPSEGESQAPPAGLRET
jgi:serine/threonine-protein kinase